MNSKTLRSLLGAFICLSTASIAHASFTVGTFADPAAGSSQNFFVFQRVSPTSGTLDGAWLIDGLHLLTPGLAAPDFFNARFELRNAQGSTGLLLNDPFNSGTMESGAGFIRFFDASNLTILRIDFDKAFLAGNAFSAGFGMGGDVEMSGLIGEPGWDDEHFGFAFTNFQPVNSNTVSMSATFTSSAVPEPGTVAALGLGATALLRRRLAKALKS